MRKLHQDDWYVVATQPSKERFATGHLQKQGFLCFFPSFRKTIHLNKRPKDVIRPLFPGYLFISMGRDAKNIRAINGTRGVKHLISSGSWPSPLPNGFADAMLKHANDDGTVSQLPSLSVGDRVEIVTGPFAQKIGEIIAMNDSGRITILMELLSGRVRVSTNTSALLPI